MIQQKQSIDITTEDSERELYNFILAEIETQGLTFYRVGHDLRLNGYSIQTKLQNGHGLTVRILNKLCNYLGYKLTITKNKPFINLTNENKMTTLPLDGVYLKLLQRLINHFPELANDDNFITSRKEMSNKAFEQAQLSGSSIGEAEEYADSILYAGLYFSRHDSLMEALRDLFPNGEETELRAIAIEYFDECAPFFEKYDLDDQFETSLEYENELLPALTEFFKNKKLQISE